MEKLLDFPPDPPPRLVLPPPGLVPPPPELVLPPPGLVRLPPPGLLSPSEFEEALLPTGRNPLQKWSKLCWWRTMSKDEAVFAEPADIQRSLPGSSQQNRCGFCFARNNGMNVWVRTQDSNRRWHVGCRPPVPIRESLRWQ